MDIVQDIFYSTYQYLLKLKTKKSSTNQKNSTKPHNDDRAISKKPIGHQFSKSTVIKNKRSIFSSSEIGSYNGMIKKCVTGTLHFVFLASSIIIILFVPPTKYSSNANHKTVTIHNDIDRLKSNDFNGTMTPASIRVRNPYIF